MIQTLKRSAYRHGYLIITAAWLYTLSFIFINYWSYHSSPQKVTSKLEERLQGFERDFKGLAGDSSALSPFLDTAKNIISIGPDAMALFVYKDLGEAVLPQLIYWNTNRVYLNNEDLKRKDSSYFISSQNGDFELIKHSFKKDEHTYLLIGMIPIRWSFFIRNKYLQTDFADNPGLDEQYEISTDPIALPVRSINGQTLFNIKLKPGKSFIAYDPVTILLRVLSIIFLLIFFHSIAVDLINKYHFRTGFFFLLGAVVFFRIIAYRFSFPFDFDKLPLFDPAVYASNILHPSLGDLLVNSILLYWLVSFYKTYHDTYPWYHYKIPKLFRRSFGLFLLTLLCYLLVHVILSLVRDSKISFDVTNFFSLDVYSVTSFFILCLLVLSFFLFSQVLLRSAIRESEPLLRQIVSVIFFGLLLMWVIPESTDIPVYLIVLVWLSGYLLLLHIRKKDLTITLIRSSFFIFWVLIFALSIAAIVIYENRKVEFEQRKSIAEKLALQADPSGENLLNIAATNFGDRFLADNFHRLSTSEFSNKYIKDSLINQNFSGYLNKYDTQIFTFDSLHHPLYNDDSVNYATLKTIILNQAKQTEIAGLYSYENAVDGFSYIFQKEIIAEGRSVGNLFITIRSKRYKSEALYPELFNQVQDIASDLNTNYAYAVYNNGRIINHFNTYGFPSQLNKGVIPAFEFTYKQVGEFSELWYSTGNNRQVIVVKRNNWLMESITLFAYLFCSFLSIILLFHLGGFLLKARFSWKKLKPMLRFNIRSQIQATIIFLSVFSFIVIGISTISFFIIRFHRNNEERLSKSIQVMANEVNNKKNSLSAFDDLPDNIGIKSGLEKTIAEISDLHNVDINYYDLNGSLLISTQPYIYNKHLLSPLMEPQAFSQLQKGHQIHYLQSEKVGLLEYLSIYVPLTDEKGNNYAYLNIPYLNSQSELNQEISGFLATLINLNAFIFLIAGAIAFFLTSRITASFGLIGEKMQAMNFGKVNEEIQWNRNDEIGLLVDEYNKMVKKLETSAKALAQSEREGAWREMARQVAHEIKNPLTPMKLSIQYLQNAIQKGSPNVKELSSNMAVTLIEQIDQLSKIAGDFSQFANIGNAQMEQFDISELLTSLIRLYSSHPKLQIEWKKEEGNYPIYSDKMQINRLFTNLFQNALEAGDEEKGTVHLLIQQQIKDGQILISLKDDAGGIPANKHKHIFIPNFTTKTSGTGLGLAICKGIVEQANGQIWFESIVGEGTTFNISLPLASNV